MPTSLSFIRISGVDGYSKDAKHRGWIDLVAWNLDTAKSQGPGSGSGRHAPPPTSFQFQVRMGAVSESLRRAVDKGTLFDEIVVETFAGSRLVQRVRFQQVYLSSSVFRVKAEGPSDDRPVSFSADFLSMRATFGEEAKEKPAVSRSAWDLAELRPAG